MFKTFITVVKPYVEYSLQANKANTAKFYLYGHQNDQWLKVFYVTARQNNYYWGTRDGAEVRTLACYQCGLGSNPSVHTIIMWFEFVLVLSFAPRGFLQVLLSSKTNFQIPIQPGIR